MGKGLKAIAAVLAILVLQGAATASAATVITGNNEGEGSHSFLIGETEVKCLGAIVAGKVSTTREKSLTLHPTFAGCTFLAEAATIDTTGCNFVLHGATSSGHGKTEIECTAGNAIKVTTPACNLTFAPQTATGGANYANLGSGTSRDVTAKFTDGLTFTKSGSFCFLVAGTTGTYTGALTMKGYHYESGPTKEDEFVEGAQTGIWWEGEEFMIEEDPQDTVITGTNASHGTHVFSAGGASLVCTTVVVAGTATTLKSGSLTLHPTYSGCKLFNEPATVDTTGCNYVLSGSTSGSGDGITEIECTASNSIKVTSTIEGMACTLTFAPQTATGGVVSTNLGSGSTRDITSHATFNLTFTKSGPLCFLIAGNTGSYTGTMTFTAYRDLGGPTKEDEFVEGSQKGLWWEGKEFVTEEG